MIIYITPLVGVLIAAAGALFFSSLTYSLREFSRAQLAEYLGRHDGDKWYDLITTRTSDLIFLTAIGRQLANIMVWVLAFASFEFEPYAAIWRYLLTIIVAGVLAIFCSITVPHAVARYASAQIVGFLAPLLYVTLLLFSPLTRLMHGTDDVVRRALGARRELPQEQIEDEILSVIEEGESQGVVNEQERDMIEAVIELRDTTAGHIMTNRSEMLALPVNATLQQIKRTVERSGHSRLPVYEGSLDHIVGILHARDLMEYVGSAIGEIDVAKMMRPAFFVPERRSLRDLLSDFRQQKVHIAIVLDEYGSTSGLVTIEDVLEELLGKMSDEHAAGDAPLLKRIDDRTSEVDARIHIDELNRLVGLSLPEEGDYETLAGFLMNAMGKIPENGAVYEHDGVRYTVIDAEPQRINRVKIEQQKPAPLLNEAQTA